MRFTPLPLAGAYLIDLEKKEDERGFFARYFCFNEFLDYGLNTHWVQMNTTLSRQTGTLRGLHFQRPPKAEAKVVRCLRGAIWDVIVDLRQDSKTFGKWCNAEINDVNRTMLYVPEGFAHGFQTLMENTELLYMHSEFYSAEHEGGLLATDQELNITWPLAITCNSDRDRALPTLEQLQPIVL